MEQKIIQIGNSVGVIIPQALAKKVFKVGDTVILEKDSVGEILYIYKKNGAKSGLTLEFFSWLNEFSEKHKDVLIELAKR